MTDAELLFFDAAPAALPLYAALKARVLACWPDAAVRVQRTQIGFSDPRLFLCASLPRRAAERREGALLATFSLPVPVASERISNFAEISRSRVTHHVLLHGPQEVDDELLAWLACSHDIGQRR